MIPSHVRARLAAWAGLWFAALVWAVNMLAGPILTTLDCDRTFPASAFVSLVSTILALGAGVVSWRAVGTGPAGFGSPRTLQFDTTVSALSALVFGFALALQTIGSVVLTGCER